MYKEEPALFNAETCTYFALEGSATDIWELLEKPKSINDICLHLCSIYDITHEECFANVSKWLDDAALLNAVKVIHRDNKE